VTRDSVTGFGASKALGAHRFIVRIPAGTRDPVELLEDYGFLGGRDGIPDEEPRARVARSTWNAIRDAARKDFNARLRKQKLPSGTWEVGENYLDHLLGKELCVLAWGTEEGDRDAASRAVIAWAALRPEERWWLFSTTVTHGGRPTDRDSGWRIALRVAFQDDTSARTRARRPKEKPVETGRLFL
jgi:hypothetical protein